MRRTLLAWLLAITCMAADAAAQTTVFLVRHAERADQAAGSAAMMATDPDLSAAGRARAESLAAMLEDAGITTIVVTQYKRTQQTAAPLAKALGLTPVVVNSKDVADAAAKAKGAQGNVLVVGHSNSTPTLIKALGVETAVEIPETEYDNLFVVTMGGPKPSMVRLRYR